MAAAALSGNGGGGGVNVGAHGEDSALEIMASSTLLTVMATAETAAALATHTEVTLP